MSGKFQVKKRIGLDFLGEGWEEAYITLNAPSYGEIKEFSKKSKVKVVEQPDGTKVEQPDESVVDEGITLLKSLFIEGKAFDGKALVDFTKEDITDLPIEAINKIFVALTEGVKSPNS